VDGDDGVARVHGARQHGADLSGLDRLGEFREARAEIGRDIFSLTSPFDQHGQVIGLGANGLGNDPVVIQPAPALQDLLRAFLVLPEVRLRDLRLDLA
jgi:hypothetical protein